jgi:hypothetical protein
MLSVLLTATLLQQAPVPESGKTVFETLSVQNLCATRSGIAPPIWGTMLTYEPIEGDRRLDLLEVRNEHSQFNPDQILEVLRHLHAAACDDGSLHLEMQESDLRVFGDANTVAQVRDQLRELTRLVARPLEIEAVLWDPGTMPIPEGVLSPQDYSQFAAQHKVLWRSRAEASNSEPVSLDQQRWTRYLRDVDVEVAQKAKISNPVTDAFCEGGRVVVVPHTLVGGDDLVLHAQFGLAERRGPIAVVSTGVPDQADLELPTLETYYGACSGHVANGGALAVSMTGAASNGGNRILTIRASCKVPPAAPHSLALGVFPISALCSLGLTQMLTPPDPYPVIGDSKESAQEVANQSPGFGAMSVDSLMSLVQTAFGADAEDNFMMEETGGYLLVYAEQDKLTRVDAILRALQERILRTVTIHHQNRIARNASSDTPAIVLHDLVVPTLFGRYATACRLLETNVIRDVYSQIAQEAAQNKPRIEALQLGSWLRARVAPDDNSIYLELQAQSAQGEVPSLRRLSPAGTLMPPSVASTRTAHNGTVLNGQTIDHGDGPTVRLEGAAYRSELVTIVAW